MKEGFYYLYSPDESEPTLVHGYKCSDLGDKFVFGFNTHDGGGLVLESDLVAETRVVAVRVVINDKILEDFAGDVYMKEDGTGD